VLSWLSNLFLNNNNNGSLNNNVESSETWQRRDMSFFSDRRLRRRLPAVLRPQFYFVLNHSETKNTMALMVMTAEVYGHLE